VEVALDVAATCIDPYRMLTPSGRAEKAANLQRRYSPLSAGSWAPGTVLTLPLLHGIEGCLREEAARINVQQQALKHVARCVCRPGWAASEDGYSGSPAGLDLRTLLGVNGAREHRKWADSWVGPLRPLLGIRETTAGWRTKRRQAPWAMRRGAGTPAAPTAAPAAADGGSAAVHDADSDMEDGEGSVVSSGSESEEEPPVEQ
jgi:hypothetical protein